MDREILLANNPFKGLHYYAEEDQALFFGREREAEEFTKLVRRGILSVLFGRSGLGKTSLLRAGVVPLLRKEDFLPVIVRLDYAESAPLPPVGQIVSAVLAAATEAKLEIDSADGTGLPIGVEEWQGSLWEFFHRHQFWSPRNDPVRPVLILDQFEEMFTLGRNYPRMREFRTELADLAENRMPQTVQSRLEASGERLAYDTRAQNYRLILALRDDYVAMLDLLRSEMPSVMLSRYLLSPLDTGHALEIVRKAGGQWIIERVTEEIVAAVTAGCEEAGQEPTLRQSCEEIEPAYLSVMCDGLFRHMVEKGKTEIDLELVQSGKGVILDSLYERSFAGLPPAAREFVEERLLTAGGYRSSMPLLETTREGIARENLESLVNCRLLSFEDRLGTVHVELSHDLLAPIVRKSRDARRAEAVAEAERIRLEEFRLKLRREKRKFMALAAAMVLLICSIGFYIFAWVFPYHTYCRNFTKRWGVIHAVGPLPSEAVKHRQWTLRLTQDGWLNPVHTVEAIDANGLLSGSAPIQTGLTDSDANTGYKENPSRFEFVFDQTGRVVNEVAYDRFGKMAWGFVYAPRDKSEVGRPKSAKGMFLGADGFPQPQGHSRAEFVEVRYDERGYETELQYKDRDGSPMLGPDNAYGQRREYDKEGRLVRITSIDIRENPTNDDAGKAYAEIKYDKNGNQIEVKAFDAKNEPTQLKAGYHGSYSHFDRWGRLTDQHFFNLSEKPAVDKKETDAHAVTLEYDDHGNVTSIKLYDTNHKPIVGGDSMWEFPAHEQRMEYDTKNHPIKIAYFDEHQKPLTGPQGWHGYRREYDEQGFVSAFSDFDQNGKPVIDKTIGTHRWEKKNDPSGKPVEERFYGVDGKPVITLGGSYHLRKNEYDRFGNLTGQSYFDVNEKPMPDQTTGAHRIVKRFDRFRHPLLTQYFDETGQPVNTKQGYQRIQSDYDEYGAETERRWLDKDSSPVKGPDGVPIIRNDYDERGLKLRTEYFDADNKPVVDGRGVHEMRFEYNDKRQQTKQQVFGLNGKPAEDEEGNHLVLTEFDDKGREIVDTRLRADDRPNKYPKLGIATVKKVYDKENQYVEQAFYDSQNRLAIGPYGFAKGCYEKEPDGRTALVYYGIDGKPAFNPLQGFAIKKIDDRTRGDTVDSYHGPDGKLMEGPEGYAEVRRHWDDQGKLISEAYFGADGKPTAGPMGYHRVEYTPDSKGKARYFDAEGHELKSLGPDTVTEIIVMSEIADIRLPAAKAGIQAGDILWRHGNWSFPESLAAVQARGIKPDEQLAAVAQMFFAERGRLSGGQADMVVIRHGQAVRLTVPPLPEKKLSLPLKDRAVPLATFEAWKGMALN